MKKKFSGYFFSTTASKKRESGKVFRCHPRLWPRSDGPRHSQNDVIPPEEDIRRIFQECSIGMGNVALLSDALAVCKPERLHSVS